MTQQQIDTKQSTLGIQVARVALTDDQIKALPTTAVEIVPAPGAGLMIVPLLALLYFDAPVAYTTGADDYLSIGTGLDMAEEITMKPAYGARRIVTLLPAQTVVSSGGSDLAPPWQTAVDLDNAALTLSVSGAGDWTGGDPANTMSVTVWYSIVPTT